MLESLCSRQKPRTKSYEKLDSSKLFTDNVYCLSFSGPNDIAHWKRWQT